MSNGPIPAEQLFAPPDFTRALGPPMCHDCGGARVQRMGELCEICSAARVARERRDALRSAWSTVPEAMRELSFDVIRDGRWVLDADAIGAACTAARSRHLTPSGAPGASLHPLVTLTGPAGAGKTSLAVAMLREHMRRGAVADATRADVGYARRARFVVAHELVEARGRARRGHAEPAEIVRASDASVLVLDEVGGSPLPDPDAVIFALLHERHRHRRPTIVTCAASRDGVSALYGGGIERRLFDDALVIDVRKAAT